MLLLPTGLVYVTGGFLASIGAPGQYGNTPYQSSLLFSEQAGAWYATGTPLMLAPYTYGTGARLGVLLRV